MKLSERKIHCSVGILTYNSETNLERCLKSVIGFTDIIIADGGSTDKTLSIAERYGCRIITQSNPGKPIADFACERNLILSAASEKWFFYIDSDEIMSAELCEEIAKIITTPGEHKDAYKVRYLKTSKDGTKVFRTYKEYYQVRFFRTDINAKFVRPVHERIELSPSLQIGIIESAWYVPLDKDDLSISIFVRKAWRRTGIQATEWTPAGIAESFSRAFTTPAVLVAKSSFKIIAVKVKWGKDAIPTKYEMLRILYAFLITIQSTKRIISFYGSFLTKKKNRK